MIHLDRISKSYANGTRSTAVLHHVSFRVSSHDLTTITGPSGSGKTTLLRIIGGLSKPDSGLVTMGGKNVYALRDRELSSYRNRMIGFIFQDYRLLANYDALENVMVPLMIAGLSRAEQRGRAKRALRTVGMDAFRKQRVNQLSGGQAQRVGIARALAMRPSVLIADEPTGNLDSTRGAAIMNLFDNLRSQQGISIIVVTHDDHLASLGNHQIRLVDGRVQSDTYASA